MPQNKSKYLIVLMNGSCLIFTVVPRILTYPIFLLLQPMHSKFALKH